MKNSIHLILIALVVFGLASSAAVARTWTDRKGRTVDADFVAFSDSKVHVKRNSDGKDFAIPFNELSDADQEFVKAAQKPRSENATDVRSVDAKTEVADYNGISLQEYLNELSKEEFEIAKMFTYAEKALSGKGLDAFILLGFVPSKSRAIMTGEDSVPAIRQILSRGNANAKCWGLFFSQYVPKKGAEQAIPEILLLLNDTDARVRKLACASVFAFALSDHITERRTIEVCLPLLNDENEDVKSAAEAGLAALMVKKSGGDWKQLFKGVSATATAAFPDRAKAKEVVKTVPQLVSPLPKAAEVLPSGPNPVRINNPNDFDVWVGLRAGKKGRDFLVQAKSVDSILVPDGKYEVFFYYLDNLYTGDSISLTRNGVEIRIVSERNGNYAIRRARE